MRPELFETIRKFLEKNHRYVDLFLTAGEILEKEKSEEIAAVLNPNTSRKHH